MRSKLALRESDDKFCGASRLVEWVRLLIEIAEDSNHINYALHNTVCSREKREVHLHTTVFITININIRVSDCTVSRETRGKNPRADPMLSTTEKRSSDCFSRPGVEQVHAVIGLRRVGYRATIYV